MRRLGEFLSPFDVSQALLTTIATAMKDVDEPCTKIKNNPYILTSINSIGFKRADELALKMGIEQENERRISSAMDYVQSKKDDNYDFNFLESVMHHGQFGLMFGPVSFVPGGSSLPMWRKFKEAFGVNAAKLNKSMKKMDVEQLKLLWGLE